MIDPRTAAARVKKVHEYLLTLLDSPEFQCSIDEDQRKVLTDAERTLAELRNEFSQAIGNFLGLRIDND